MADESNGAEATDVTAEGRLRAAGFINSAGFWKEPGGERLFDTADAIAALDAGEYPAVDRTLVIPTPGGAGAAEHARMIEEQMRRQEEEAASPPPPLPWLIAQAEVIATATVEKMKPVIRAEVRAALRKGRSS